MVFPLPVRSHVGDFHEDCLCASAQPTCIDPTVNFQLMATLYHTDCVRTLELTVCSPKALVYSTRSGEVF